MKISTPAPGKEPRLRQPWYTPTKHRLWLFFIHFWKIFLVLRPFFAGSGSVSKFTLDPFHNEFFHILDPYQKWYGSATLVLGSKIKIKELHVKFSVFIYESKRTSAQKMYRYHIFTSQTERGGNMLLPVMQIRIILIRIWMRIQDVKKFVTDKDPDPRWTLIQIRIQKTKRIRIQQKRTMYQENLQKVYEKRS